MRRILPLPAALLVALLLPAAAAASPPDTALRLDYRATVHGVPLMHMQVALRMTPSRYRLRLTYRTVGVIGFFFRGHQADSVVGVWHGNRPAPLRYVAAGTWHGVRHLMAMDYRGDMPVIREVTPPIRATRAPVPPAMQGGTIDTLSAVAELLRVVATTGGCDASERTFDGRRLSVIAAHDDGRERLVRAARAGFAGPALRCAFTGRMLAGFLRGKRARDSRPLHGVAWLAPLTPGGLPVPVRLRFQTDWFGNVTMKLIGVQPAEPALAERR
jgi:hypothetical protein